MSFPTLRLGEISVKRGGSVDPSKHLTETFELFSIPAYDEGKAQILLGSDIGSSKKCVKPGDVMVSRIVPHIRRAWVVGETVGYRQIASGEWIVFRSDQVWPRYLRWVLVGDDFHERYMRTVSGVGGSLLRARPTEVDKIEVPLPPLSEQKRIARILDTADALRAKRRETIAQLDALVQSVFMEMFGSNHDEWAEAKVAELASNEKGSIRTGPFGSQLLHSEFVEKGIKVLGIDNVVSNSFREGEPRYITSEKYEQLHRYTVRPGDVLITIMGTCGRCAVVPDDIETAINTKHLCAITLDQKRCLPDYLRACFLWHPAAQDFLKRNAKGAIMAGLNMGIIKRLPVIVPPVHLQQHFVDALRSVYAQRERLRAHLDELDTLFASLQSRAFAGEL